MILLGLVGDVLVDWMWFSSIGYLQVFWTTIGAKAGIFQIVDGLAARGLAILLISDEVEEVLYQSHRILVMRSGRLVGTYDLQRVSEQELREVIYA